ncbi:MAG: OmpA family protein, partial [Bacteroidota bacterium]
LKTAQDEAVPATIEIRDVITNELTKIDVDSVTGEYAFVVGLEHDLMLSVKQKGFAFTSQYVSSADSSNTKPKNLDIELNELEVGGQYTINDILFASNSFQINDTIKVVLNEFADYLAMNNGMKLVLQGHTDDIGSTEDNMVLSKNRAKAVSDYLISHGVAKERLSSEGFGESKPIASNSTEEGRAKNRRTVFVVSHK